MVRKILEKSSKYVLMVALGVYCALPLPSFSAETIKIGGTGSALGTAQALAGALGKKHPDIKFTIVPSLGSSGSIKAAAKGAIDISFSSRPLKAEESGAGLAAVELSRTPLIFIVRSDVAVAGFATDELASIYAGKVQAWPDGKRIRLILRPATESDISLIKKLSPAMGNAVDSALAREGMIVTYTDQENVDMLEKTPGALGFSTLAQTMSEKRQVKVLTLNGVKPSIKALASGAYPLYKSFYIVAKTQPSVTIQKFIDFIQSSEGKRILEANGNMPIKVITKKE